MNKRLSAIGTIASALLLSATAAAQTKTWSVNADFDAGTLTNTVHIPSDQLNLGGTPVSKTNIVWATNTTPSWVVRLDTLTGKQTGRFDAALQFINGQPTGAQPPKGQNWPGRVAVDTNGDVWIINRAFGFQGTLSKFSGDINHCIDRNNNGVIDTSKDTNNDGVINPDDPVEFFGQNDECILTTIPIGPPNVYPRGVAVDKKGKIWVSTHNDGMVYRYNPAEPVTLEATVNVGGNPYSQATGGDYLYVSRSAQPPVRVHIDTLAVQTAPAGCGASYGVVADPTGSVAWFGGYFSLASGIYRWNTVANTCSNHPTNACVTAVTLDLQGKVWSANYCSNTISKLEPTGALIGTYPAGGSSPHGMSVDFQGNIWVVLHGPYALSKVNSSTGALLGVHSIGAPPGYNYDPYIYSDFTGVQVDRQAPYTKLGTWSGVHDGGTPGIPWSEVNWNSEAQGSIPAGTSLQVAVRAANTLGALAAQPYTATSNGVPLVGIQGQFVQVQVTFNGPGYLTPVLSDITVEGACAGGVGEACCITAADCVDADVCTTDACPVAGAACVHTPTAGCCFVDADCNDANLCTTDSCPAVGGQCQNVPVAGCCMSNADCTDANPCTANTCSGPGGQCSFPLINGCCNVDADCTQGNVCSSSTCSGPGGICSTSSIPGCCTTNADCADVNACTSDVCDVATGTCTNTPSPGCCNVNGECNDGQPCTQDSCSGPGGVCVFSAIAGCCMNDGQCDDGSSCTTDACSGPGGVCTFTQSPSCCDGDSDCPDGDLCTTDTCPVIGGACSHTPTAGCCLAAADCQDGNVCTSDVCSFPGGTCDNPPIVNCCVTDADCPVGACIGNWCTTDDPTSSSSAVTTGTATGAGGGGGASTTTTAAGTGGGGGAAPEPVVLEGGGCACRTSGGDGGRGTPGALAVGLLGLLAAASRRARRGGVTSRAGRPS